MSEKSANSPLYGIGAVARLTGLTDHTIRVWERRYAAVVAARAPNGRRQYTEADVQKLGLLKVLTDHGVSISRVAADSIDDLRQRVDSLADLATPAAAATVNVAVLGDFLPRQLLEHPRPRLAAVATIVRPMRANDDAADAAACLVDQPEHLRVHRIERLLIEQATGQPRLVAGDRQGKSGPGQRRYRLEAARDRAPFVCVLDEVCGVVIDDAVAIENDQAPADTFCSHLQATDSREMSATSRNRVLSPASSASRLVLTASSSAMTMTSSKKVSTG